MTFLVFSVLPAPDSPLGRGEGGGGHYAPFCISHSVTHSLPLRCDTLPSPSPTALIVSQLSPPLPPLPPPSPSSLVPPSPPSRDEDGLIVPVLQHVSVGIVRNGVDVWWHLGPPPTLEHVDDLLRVDGEVAVGVDGNTEEA